MTGISLEQGSVSVQEVNSSNHSEIMRVEVYSVAAGGLSLQPQFLRTGFSDVGITGCHQ